MSTIKEMAAEYEYNDDEKKQIEEDDAKWALTRAEMRRLEANEKARKARALKRSDNVAPAETIDPSEYENDLFLPEDDMGGAGSEEYTTEPAAVETTPAPAKKRAYKPRAKKDPNAPKAERKARAPKKEPMGPDEMTASLVKALELDRRAREAALSTPEPPKPPAKSAPIPIPVPQSAPVLQQPISRVVSAPAPPPPAFRSKMVF